MAKKPLVQTSSDLVGSVREDQAFIGQGEDLTFIKGYSDKRQQIDAALRRGETPPVQLTHRYHWVTVQRPGGRSDLQTATRFLAQGYRAVRYEEAASLGIEVPVQARQTADGHIMVGDAQLFVCDAATAERNRTAGRRAIAERSTDDMTASDLHRAGRDVGGADANLVTSHTEQHTEVVKG